jgi:hypothetical protein
MHLASIHKSRHIVSTQSRINTIQPSLFSHRRPILLLLLLLLLRFMHWRDMLELLMTRTGIRGMERRWLHRAGVVLWRMVLMWLVLGDTISVWVRRRRLHWIRGTCGRPVVIVVWLVVGIALLVMAHLLRSLKRWGMV